MKRIYLWQGFHSQEFKELFSENWQQEDLLICCPPGLTDFSFTSQLPKGDVEFIGSWDKGLPEIYDRSCGSFPKYPEEPVLGVFTTGTSRNKPKLVLYSKKNVEACGKSILALFDQKKFDSIYCFPQPYHVFGLLLGYALCEYSNLKLETEAGRYSSRYHEGWLGRDKHKTLTLFTPTQLRDLAHYIEVKAAEVQPSYSCIVGGAQVLQTDWNLAKDKLKIAAPSIGYGCTEASPGVSHLPPGIRPEANGDVGFPLANLSVTIKPNAGIEVKGASICLATIEDGKLDFPKQLFISDIMDTGKDGRMIFKARSDVLLNRGGEKYSLEHIENLLKARFGIDSVCVAVKDPRLGEELGIVVKRSDLTLSKSEIYTGLEEEFGKNFSQRHFVEVAELPVNDNLKVDRKVAARILSN